MTLLIEIVRTEEFVKLDRDTVMLALGKIDYIVRGQKARLAGLKVPDHVLSAETGVTSLNAPDARALASGMYITNVVDGLFTLLAGGGGEFEERFDSSALHKLNERFGRRRIDGVNYVIGVDDAAVFLKFLILCEILQAVV